MKVDIRKTKTSSPISLRKCSVKHTYPGFFSSRLLNGFYMQMWFVDQKRRLSFVAFPKLICPQKHFFPQETSFSIKVPQSILREHWSSLVLIISPSWWKYILTNMFYSTNYSSGISWTVFSSLWEGINSSFSLPSSQKEWVVISLVTIPQVESSLSVQL